ncbi:unnamed protein product [Closterium sp. Naga37s-1]|nr:unnamed protein product [Closterium sp. Naga37s-1]
MRAPAGGNPTLASRLSFPQFISARHFHTCHPSPHLIPASHSFVSPLPPAPFPPFPASCRRIPPGARPPRLEEMREDQRRKLEIFSALLWGFEALCDEKKVAASVRVVHGACEQQAVADEARLLGATRVVVHKDGMGRRFSPRALEQRLPPACMVLFVGGGRLALAKRGKGGVGAAGGAAQGKSAGNKAAAGDATPNGHRPLYIPLMRLFGSSKDRDGYRDEGGVAKGGAGEKAKVGARDSVREREREQGREREVKAAGAASSSSARSSNPYHGSSSSSRSASGAGASPYPTARNAMHASTMSQGPSIMGSGISRSGPLSYHHAAGGGAGSMSMSSRQDQPAAAAGANGGARRLAQLPRSNSLTSLRQHPALHTAKPSIAQRALSLLQGDVSCEHPPLLRPSLAVLPCYPTLSHTLPFSPTPSYCLPLSPTLSHSLPFSPTLSHSLPLSTALSHSFSLSPTLSHSLPLSPTLSHSLPLSTALSHSFSLSPTLSHSLPLSPILSHSLPLSPALSRSLPFSPTPSHSLPLSPALSCSLPLSPALSSFPRRPFAPGKARSVCSSPRASSPHASFFSSSFSASRPSSPRASRPSSPRSSAFNPFFPSSPRSSRPSSPRASAGNPQSSPFISPRATATNPFFPPSFDPSHMCVQRSASFAGVSAVAATLAQQLGWEHEAEAAEEEEERKAREQVRKGRAVAQHGEEGPRGEGQQNAQSELNARLVKLQQQQMEQSKGGVRGGEGKVSFYVGQGQQEEAMVRADIASAARDAATADRAGRGASADRADRADHAEGVDCVDWANRCDVETASSSSSSDDSSERGDANNADGLDDAIQGTVHHCSFPSMDASDAAQPVLESFCSDISATSAATSSSAFSSRSGASSHWTDIPSSGSLSTPDCHVAPGAKLAAPRKSPEAAPGASGTPGVRESSQNAASSRGREGLGGRRAALEPVCSNQMRAAGRGGEAAKGEVNPGQENQGQERKWQDGKGHGLVGEGDKQEREEAGEGKEDARCPVLVGRFPVHRPRQRAGVGGTMGGSVGGWSGGSGRRLSVLNKTRDPQSVRRMESESESERDRERESGRVRREESGGGSERGMRAPAACLMADGGSEREGGESARDREWGFVVRAAGVGEKGKERENEGESAEEVSVEGEDEEGTERDDGREGDAEERVSDRRSSEARSEGRESQERVQETSNKEGEGGRRADSREVESSTEGGTDLLPCVRQQSLPLSHSCSSLVPSRRYFSDGGEEARREGRRGAPTMPAMPQRAALGAEAGDHGGDGWTAPGLGRSSSGGGGGVAVRAAALASPTPGVRRSFSFTQGARHAAAGAVAARAEAVAAAARAVGGGRGEDGHGAAGVGGAGSGGVMGGAGVWEGPWRKLQWREVEQATDGFATRNLLGTCGGYSRVYQGRLPGGQQIAVRREMLTCPSAADGDGADGAAGGVIAARQGGSPRGSVPLAAGRGLSSEVAAELAVLATLSHRHVAQLVGVCAERRDEVALVFEHMEGGTLDSALRGDSAQEGGTLESALRGNSGSSAAAAAAAAANPGTGESGSSAAAAAAAAANSGEHWWWRAPLTLLSGGTLVLLGISPLRAPSGGCAAAANPGPLAWSARPMVAHQLALALHYLHEGAPRAVVHRNVRTASVMLTRGGEAKLSEFGLALFAAPNDAPMQVPLAGTFGYLAPEYLSHGAVSTATDVFAFGVVLLELLSGQPPVDDSRPRGMQCLVQWARPLIEAGRLHEVADPALQGGYHPHQFALLARTALLCTHKDPSQRPSMLQVLHLIDSGPPGKAPSLPHPTTPLHVQPSPPRTRSILV